MLGVAKWARFPAKHLSPVPVDEFRGGACLRLYWAAKSLAVIGQNGFQEPADSGCLIGDSYHGILPDSEHPEVKSLVMEHTQTNTILQNSWTRSLMPFDVSGVKCYRRSR